MEQLRKVSCPSGNGITSVPEPIGTHIVSFLPIEDAFRTIVLSRQWRRICASIPNLNFGQTYFELKSHSMSFKDFVYGILGLRSSLGARKFNLVATVDDSSLGYILSWISFVICHDVQELRLFFSKEIEQLPVDLFTSRTLRVLDLIHIDLQPPSNIELPMLKTLRFSFVTFHSSYPPSEIISASPGLEEFSMLACSWDDNVAIYVSSPSLKFVSLTVFYPTSVVIISAPSLNTIKYIGNPPYITPKTLSSLSIADFEFTTPFGSDNSTLENLGHHASNILRGLHYLDRLNLDFLFVEYVTRVPDLFACWPNPYASLKDLKLEMFRTVDHANIIIFLLKMHLNLQTLSIFVKPDFTARKVIKVGRYLPSKDLSSGGILKKLKIVQIRDFEGSGCEIELVRYLLLNARVMEVMQIKYSDKLKEDEDIMMTISEELLAFPQLSPSLVVLFS